MAQASWPRMAKRLQRGSKIMKITKLKHMSSRGQNKQTVQEGSKKVKPNSRQRSKGMD